MFALAVRLLRGETIELVDVSRPTLAGERGRSVPRRARVGRRGPVLEGDAFDVAARLANPRL
jgi:hypothetical protein